MFNRKTDDSDSWLSKALSHRADGQMDGPGNGATAVASPPASRSQDAPQPGRGPQRSIAGEVNDAVESLIGEHSSFDGTLRSDSSVRISGTLTGEVESKRTVFIEPSARVKAKVSGATVLVAGEVDGEIYCQGRVELKPSARVLGSLTAGTLIMHEGAFIDGHLKMLKEGERTAQPKVAAVAAA